MKIENWKEINGHNAYMVSSFGRVKSIERKVNSRFGKHRTVRERILKSSLADNSYLQAWIGISKNIHRLVAVAFIPNPENKKTVNHKDGNKLNNNVENLEWATHKENVKHAAENSLTNYAKGEQMGASKLKESEVLNIYKDKRGCAEISKHYPVSRTAIHLIKTGKNWSYLTNSLTK